MSVDRAVERSNRRPHDLRDGDLGRARHRRDRLADVVLELVDEISTSTSLDRLLEIIVTEGLGTFGCTGGVLVIVGRDGEVERTVTSGATSDIVGALGSLHLRRQLPIMAAVRRHRPIFVGSRADALDEYPELAALPMAGESWAAVPIGIDGYLAGVVGFTFDRARAFDSAEQDFVRALSALLALGLSPARHDRRAAPTEIAVLDEQGVIVDVNEAWRRFALENGGAADTGLGDSYLTCCDDAGDPTSAAVARSIRRALGGADDTDDPVLVPCHSPTEQRWFDTVVSARTGSDGACHGATVMLTPCRRGVGADPRFGEGLLDRIRDGVLVVDTHARRILYANEAATELTGYAREELLDLPPTRLLGEGYQAEQVALHNYGARGWGRYALTVHRSDGTTCPVELHVGEEDERGRRVLVAVDMTEQAAHESAVIQARTLEALLDERERVARDLHDGVVQDVLATAMTLAAMVQRMPVELRQRIEDLIDAQDAIVRRLRLTVFGMGRPDATASAVDAVRATIDEARRSLGFEPILDLHGDVGGLDDDVVVGHLLLALREALSNVARHAGARNVRVSLTVDGGVVELRIADDGVGLETSRVTAGYGLGNLQSRAERLGGHCWIGPVAGGGTEVVWTARSRHS